MMTTKNLYQVNIEFLRIQTFLFLVPRLRDMIGANVLLGETIRVKLPDLAKQTNSYLHNLDKLPSVDELDPLYDEEIDPNHQDDPKQLLLNYGLLSRDGGHFRALFPDENSANSFKTEAESVLIHDLPGLRFEISVELVKVNKTDKLDSFPNKIAQSQAIFDLPPLQVCQESGNSPAVAEPFSVGGGKKAWISATTQKNKVAGARFFDRSKKSQTHDIIGLLSHKLPPVYYQFEEPTDLEDLCGNDYLAVIHADGNSVGSRFLDWRKTYNPNDNQDSVHDFLLEEAHGEQFFHSMRVAVRRAVIDGLTQTFYGFKGKFRPYQLLMLGGDDLLLVCQAKYAFDFLVHYADALTRIKLVDGKTLSIGAGVVIASPNLPFHHLHHLAEELAGSAKRLYRSDPDKNLSVVDWVVSSNSWVNDPIALRQGNEDYQGDAVVSYEVNGQAETLALSGRPYPILGMFIK